MNASKLLRLFDAIGLRAFNFAVLAGLGAAAIGIAVQ